MPLCARADRCRPRLWCESSTRSSSMNYNTFRKLAGFGDYLKRNWKGGAIGGITGIAAGETLLRLLNRTSEERSLAKRLMYWLGGATTLGAAGTGVDAFRRAYGEVAAKNSYDRNKYERDRLWRELDIQQQDRKIWRAKQRRDATVDTNDLRPIGPLLREPKKMGLLDWISAIYKDSQESDKWLKLSRDSYNSGIKRYQEHQKILKGELDPELDPEP